jgi:hypothetical protein
MVIRTRREPAAEREEPAQGLDESQQGTVPVRLGAKIQRADIDADGEVLVGKIPDRNHRTISELCAVLVKAGQEQGAALEGGVLKDRVGAPAAVLPPVLAQWEVSREGFGGRGSRGRAGAAAGGDGKPQQDLAREAEPGQGASGLPGPSPATAGLQEPSPVSAANRRFFQAIPPENPPSPPPEPTAR